MSLRYISGDIGVFIIGCLNAVHSALIVSYIILSVLVTLLYVYTFTYYSGVPRKAHVGFYRNTSGVTFIVTALSMSLITSGIVLTPLSAIGSVLYDLINTLAISLEPNEFDPVSIERVIDTCVVTLTPVVPAYLTLIVMSHRKY